MSASIELAQGLDHAPNVGGVDGAHAVLVQVEAADNKAALDAPVDVGEEQAPWDDERVVELGLGDHDVCAGQDRHTASGAAIGLAAGDRRGPVAMPAQVAGSGSGLLKPLLDQVVLLHDEHLRRSRGEVVEEAAVGRDVDRGKILRIMSSNPQNIENLVFLF